jgi:GNAT superfamily N-acetyltransferase
MMTIARAELPDIPDVLQLLNTAAAWLHERGIDQWPHEFTAERVAPHVAMAQVWLVRDDDGLAVGTMRLTTDADPDFWTPTESAEEAIYVSGLAINRSGAGLGALMLRWAADYAGRLGWHWLRLDARRDNAKLHRYYLDRGWRYLRTVTAPGRFSGALFDHAALPDPAARAAFVRFRRGGWFMPGDRVAVAEQGDGIIWSIYTADPDSGGPQMSRQEDFGVPAATPGYWVRLDSGPEVLIPRRDVTTPPFMCADP